MRPLAPRLALLAALAAPLPAAASWGDGLRGDGERTTVARDLAPFDRVRVDGSLDVRVRVGGAQRVEVTIDSNLQDRVRTESSGGELRVAIEDARPSPGARVDVTVPALRALALRGSAEVTVEGGAGDQDLAVSGSGDLRWKGSAGALDVAVAGSGTIVLEGRAERLEASVAGSGDVKARPLTARSAKVAVAGSGDVEVTLAGGTLDAAITGSGDVIWWGEAEVTGKSVIGSGDIEHR